MSNSSRLCTDPFSEIAGQIIEKLDEIGTVVDYDELERWADKEGIGKYTLRMVLCELVEQGAAVAPEGFCEDEGGLEPPKPKKIGVRKADPKDVERVRAYLAEYWSVGLLRLFDDMARSGVKNVNEALKEVIRLGYAELSRIGVVNATQPRAPNKKIRNIDP
ncbi:MAG: hypothetical protein ABC596_04110 [Candidatus Methanosuratincola petrocarbonis]